MITQMDTPPSKRATVRQKPQRAHYDRETVNAILDEGLICHVGFIVEGAPIVIPTGYARDGDRLLLHGGAASRLMGQLGEGVDVSIAVTLVDGLVLADVAFRHSMNYRSVVLFGRARAITDAAGARGNGGGGSADRRGVRQDSVRSAHSGTDAAGAGAVDGHRVVHDVGRRLHTGRSIGGAARTGIPDQVAPTSWYHLSRHM